MMNDVIVMQCVCSRIGDHRVKQRELFISRWRDTFRNPSISFDHDGMHPPIVAVANEADRIGRGCGAGMSGIRSVSEVSGRFASKSFKLT